MGTTGIRMNTACEMIRHATETDTLATFVSQLSDKTLEDAVSTFRSYVLGDRSVLKFREAGTRSMRPVSVEEIRAIVKVCTDEQNRRALA